MPDTIPTRAPTLLQWIQDQALEDEESLRWALTKEYHVVYDNDGVPAVVFGSCEGAQSHPLFGAEQSIHPNGRYQEWAGIQEDFLDVPFVEGMWKTVPCTACNGEGRVDDPNPCPRCQRIGCRTISCPRCNGTGQWVDVG